MAISSIEEILEQRRRQAETKKRNEEKAKRDAQRQQYGPQTQAQAQAAKQEKPQFFAGYGAQPTKAPVKAPARNPVYAPIKFVPAASDRTKDDQAQPARYVPVPYQVPEMKKDNDKPDRYTPMPYGPAGMGKDTPALIPVGRPMEIGLTSDRPDTGVADLNQTQIAQAPTTALDPRGWRPERTKDDEAFPVKKKPWYTDWGKDSPIGAGAALEYGVQQMGAAKDFLRPDTGATNNPAWDYRDEQIREREAQDKSNVGDMTFENPFKGVINSAGHHLDGTVDNPDAGLGGYFDPGRLWSNLSKNTESIPGVGELWRGAGDLAWNGADWLSALSTDALSTRVPTPIVDPETGEVTVTNDANIGQASNAFFETVNDTLNPFSDDYNPIGKEDATTDPWEKWNNNSPINQLGNAFMDNFYRNIGEGVAASTMDDADKVGLTPEEIANQEAVVKTMLSFSSVESQESALRDLATQDETVAKMEAEAARLLAMANGDGMTVFEEQIAAMAYDPRTDPASKEKIWQIATNPEAALLDPVLSDEAKKLAQQVIDARNMTDEDRKAMQAAAADLGMQANDLRKMTPNDIVDQHTDVLRTLALGILVDPLDWVTGAAGALVSLAPGARRLSKAVSAADKLDETTVIKALTTAGKFDFGPDIAAIAKNVPGMSFLDQVDTAIFTPKVTKAAQESKTLFSGIAVLIRDADTTDDIKTILRILATDPAQLVKGVPANVFSGAGLQDLAHNGVVKFAPQVFNKQFVDALQRSYRSVVGEILNSATLSKAGLIDKIPFMDELVANLNQGGARVYNVATAFGEAPIGTTKATARMTGNGQAVIDYIDSKGTLLGSSDEMAAAAARRSAMAIEQQAKVGKITDPNFVRNIGSTQRKIQSAISLNLSPGSIVTNAVGANMQLITDGNWSFRRIDDIMEHAARFGGGGQLNLRMAGDTTAKEFVGGIGLGQIRGGKASVPLTGGRVGLGEENLAARAWYGAFKRSFDRFWERSINVNVNAIFDAVGIDDPSFRKSFMGAIRDAGRHGDKQAMIKTVGDIVAGRTRPFDLGDLNPIFVEALTPDGLTEFNKIIATANPADLDATRNAIADLMLKERFRWENYLLTDPPVTGRTVFSQMDNTRDVADMQTDAKAFIKAGADPAAVNAELEIGLEAQKQVQNQLDTLSAMIAEAGDPKQRYVLYNTWMELYDLKAGIRMEIGKLAEEAMEAGGDTWKTVYYPRAAALWQEYGDKAGIILADAQTGLTSGLPVKTNFSAWDIFQKQAEKSNAELRAAMDVEVGAGKFDSRMKGVIEAGRAMEDKAVTTAFAAARRFQVDGAMDYIISAEKDARYIGAQGSAYLQKTFDDVVRPALASGNKKKIDEAYQKYFAIRNQIWREVRDGQVERWAATTRQIVSEGIGGGARKDLSFDLGGTMGQVTLIGPGTGKNKGMWAVALDDGKVHYIPGEDAKKTTGVVTSEQFFVPNTVIDKYKNLSKESKIAVEMELDNIASAQFVLKNTPEAPPVRPPGTPTATEIAYKERDAKRAESIWNTSGATQQSTGGLPARTVMPPPVVGVTKSNLPNMGDIAKEQIAAIAEARNTMRAEWERIAVGEWELPSLDTLVMQYQRNGVVNVPEDLAEDLYGSVIAGNRIDSQKDIETFITDYSNMKRQTDKSAATVQQAKTYSKMDRDAIIEARGVDLAANGYTPEQLARMNRREVITALDTIDDVMPDEVGVAGYDGALGGPESVRLWSETKDENLLNIGNMKNGPQATMNEVVEATTKRGTNSGNIKSWTLSDTATRQIDVLTNLENVIQRRLDSILAASPTALNPNQQLRFIDMFRRTILPEFDKIVITANDFGNKMQSFTMVDFTNNYHIDNIISAAGVPYHFWFTRSVKNLIERFLTQPNIVSKQAFYERMNTVEDKQSDVAPRDRGTVPIKIGGTEYRVRLGNWLPFGGTFGQNTYADPEDANSAYEYYVESLKASGFGPNTAWSNAMLLASGRGNEIDWMSVTPITRIARDAWQAGGGELPEFMERPNSNYLTGREVDRMAVEGLVVDGKPVTEKEALLVQDYIRQLESGEAPLPEHEAMTARTKAIYDAAYQRVGGEKLLNSATGVATGSPVYTVYDADQQNAENTNDFFGLQYGPENKFGSLESAKAVDSSESYRTRQNVDNLDTMRPGVVSVNNEKSAEKQTIFGEMNAAVEAFLAKNPGATRDEIDGVQSPFYARVKALDEKYPSAQAYEGSGQPPKGMNPKERAQWELNRILYSVPEGKPVMPESATPEQERAYYAQYNEWKIKQFDLIEQNVAGLLRLDPTEQADVQGWQGELVKLVKNQYASELLRNFENRFSGENYKGWDDTVSLQEEMTRAQWAEREAAVTERVGAEAAALLQQYYGLPKGSEERRKFKAAHPIIAQAMVASFTPEKYDEVTEKFGADAWTVYANRPVGPGTGATEDQLAAYYAQLDQYNAQHPGANAAYMYVRGRSRQYNPDAGSVYMDWGQDYNEAIRIFGPNIFEIVDNFPDGKTAQSAYYKAHPELSGYWEWNKALKGTMAPAQSDPELAPLDPATYTGERPVGSGRVPVTDEAGRPTTGAASFFPGFTGASRGDFAAVGAPSATMPTETQAAAAGEATGATVTPGAAGDRTWQDWAAQNPNYGKYGKGNPEFAAATAAVGAEFDADGLATWNAYYDLPKDSAAREEYKRAHPELRVMTMAGYNPDEYKQAKELFGDDAWMEWANIPPYDESDDAKAARAAYLDAHPQAKLLSAWVNGRPGNFDESATGDDFAYNFGADFAEAESMFGEDIWSVWAGYSSKWDKATKRAYHERFPNLGPMMDWWYGNEAGQGRAAGAGAARSYGGGGGRSYGGGGGGGGYSGWGGGDDGGWGQPVDLNMPYVQAEQLSRELQTQAPRPAQHRNFSPDWWIKAGDRTGPDPIKPVKVWKSGNSW
ncbi:MAG: hypothetical protein IPL32_18240 [Chloracidobacterium sp.]|nr:hypothetical protein [Chloracidobacterium sp.]